VADLNVVPESQLLADADFKIASAGGDAMENDGKTALYIKNESGAQRVVTIAAPGQCSHGFTHPKVITITAATTLYKSLTFPQVRFGARLSITYDTTSGLSLVGVRQKDYHG
jgi:hypothetical protein